MYYILPFLLLSQDITIEQDKANNPNSVYVYADDTNAAKVFSFAINCLSRSKKIQQPVDLRDGKKKGFLRINLEDYKINKKAWESLQKDHPYSKKHIRVDWFISRAFNQPNYNKLLGLSTLKSFRELTGYADAAELQEHALILSGSKVARSSMIITRSPTLIGSIWSLQECGNPFTDLIKEVNSNSQRQLCGTLPNGLLVYFAYTPGKKDPSSESSLDTTFYVDPYNFSRVAKVSSSCIYCHVQGIMSFKCDIREAVSDGLEIKTSIGKEKADLLKSILIAFSTDIYKSVDRGQEIYEDAVLYTTGKTAKEINTMYRNIVDRYNSSVGFKEALAESGMSEEMFREICRNSSETIMQILRSRRITREQWENMQKTFRADD